MLLSCSIQHWKTFLVQLDSAIFGKCGKKQKSLVLEIDLRWKPNTE